MQTSASHCFLPWKAALALHHPSSSAPSSRACSAWDPPAPRCSQPLALQPSAFTNAFQAAPLIFPLPFPLELAEEHIGMRLNPEGNDRNWLCFLSKFVPLLRLFGPSLLQQLQEPCALSRSLPRPTLLQAHTGHQGLPAVEQAFLPANIRQSFLQPSPMPPSGSLCPRPFSAADLPSLLPLPSRTHKPISWTHKTKVGLKSNLPTKVGSDHDAQDFAYLHLDSLQGWRSYHLSRPLSKPMSVTMEKNFPMLQAGSLSLILPCASIKSLALFSQ